MKKRFGLFIVAIALVAGAVAFVGLLAPEPADAFPNRCRCLQERQTAEMQGNGHPTCAEAQANLRSQLFAAVGCDDFCSVTVVYTNACFNNEPNNPTWFKSTGYLVYRCEVCIEEELQM